VLGAGETIVGCAVREFKEETGLRLRCDTACVPAERSHEGVPVVVSNALHTPMAFSAADAVTRDSSGNVLFHYAIIEVRRAVYIHYTQSLITLQQLTLAQHPFVVAGREWKRRGDFFFSVLWHNSVFLAVKGWGGASFVVV
jgi:8-oxo-dGTP pyrophosphatase MutT (NUDIX family)